MGWMSSTTVLTPFSANSLTISPPMPPAPPVTTTTSFRQSYRSSIQLLRVLSEYHRFNQRAMEKRNSVCRREYAVGCRMDRSWPFFVYRASRTRGSSHLGFRTVLPMSLKIGSATRPSRGRNPLCMGMLAHVDMNEQAVGN
jgi:hypothetical protein